jgi:DNA modification methylase
MSFVGIDLSEEYIKIARLRIAAAERTAQIAPQQDPLL